MTWKSRNWCPSNRNRNLNEEEESWLRKKSSLKYTKGYFIYSTLKTFDVMTEAAYCWQKSGECHWRETVTETSQDNEEHLKHYFKSSKTTCSKWNFDYTVKECQNMELYKILHKYSIASTERKHIFQNSRDTFKTGTVNEDDVDESGHFLFSF